MCDDYDVEASVIFVVELWNREVVCATIVVDVVLVLVLDNPFVYNNNVHWRAIASVAPVRTRRPLCGGRKSGCEAALRRPAEQLQQASATGGEHVRRAESLHQAQVIAINRCGECVDNGSDCTCDYISFIISQ